MSTISPSSVRPTDQPPCALARVECDLAPSGQLPSLDMQMDVSAVARAALLAVMTPTAAGNLLRLAFHDAGTFSNATTANG